MKNEDVCKTKKLKTAYGIYGNPTEIPIIRKNQFLVSRSLKSREMVSFSSFARIASLCMGFDLGTLHGYFSL